MDNDKDNRPLEELGINQPSKASQFRDWLASMCSEYGIIVISLVVILLVVVLFFLIVFFLWDQLKIWEKQIKTWDVVIISALVAGFFSILHLFISKHLELLRQKKYYLFEKRTKSYENIISFIFKYQVREGYTPKIDLDEAQIACFSINQQVMLWASKEVQRAWERYLVDSWQQNNETYQINAANLFHQITIEVGQCLKRDSFYDCMELRLFYDIPSFTIMLTTNQKEKSS